MFNSKKVYICSGEVAEWSNAPVLKTGVLSWYRGFESLLLRSNIGIEARTTRAFFVPNSKPQNMNIETFREYCLSLPLVSEDMPFDDNLLAFRLKGKIFACVSMNHPDIVVLKCDPERAVELREQFVAVEGAFHWNKKYWNQISMQSDVKDNLLCELIQHAWNEVNKKLPKKDRLPFLE